MNVILDDENASFPVHTSASDKDGDCQPTVARLSLRLVKRKRQRSDLPSGQKKGCYVSITMWSPTRIATSRSTGKSFQLQYSWERRATSWGCHAKIFSINDVVDVEAMEKRTYVAVGLSDGNEKHAVVVMILARKEVTMLQPLVLRKLPEEAIFLRGPRLVLHMSSKVRLLTLAGSSLPINSEGHSKLQIHNICNTERDTEAIVLATTSDMFSSYSTGIYSLTWKGVLEHICELSVDVPGQSLAVSASYRKGLAILTNKEEGTLLALDIATGNLKRRCESLDELGGIYSISFYGNKLLMCSKKITGNIFATSFHGFDAPSVLSSVPTLVFQDQCEAMNSSEHTHFFAPWRDVLLQINSSTGTCCRDEKLEQERFSGANEEVKNPSLRVVGAGLENRVHDGVRSLMASAVGLEDKIGMLTHVRNMLGQSRGRLPVLQNRNGFIERLSNLAILEERMLQSPKPAILAARVADVVLTGVDTKTTMKSSKYQGEHLVRLIDCKCGVDESSERIIVILQLEVSADENDSGPLRAIPSFRFSMTENVPEAWDVFHLGKFEWNKPIRFGATTPLPIGTIGVSLDDLSINVKLTVNRTGSQYLGTFPVLPSLREVDNLTQKIGDGLLGAAPHKCDIHILAEGDNAHEMKTSPWHPNGNGVNVITGDRLTKVTFTATTARELTATIGRLKASVSDATKLRSTQPLSRQSLVELDLAALAFSAEVQCLEKIGSQRDSFGLNQAEVREVLESQQLVDEVIGRLEETLLGL